MAQSAEGLQALCTYDSNDTDDNGESGPLSGDAPSPVDIDMHKKLTLSVLTMIRVTALAV